MTKMSRRFRIVGFAAVALLTIAVALGAEALAEAGNAGSAQGQSSTSSTSTLPPCPPQLPPGVTCDPATIAANRANARAQIASQWPPSATSYMTRAEAIQTAEQWAPKSRGTDAHAEFTTYADAAEFVGESPTPDVDPQTEVWLVTVFAHPDGFIYRPGPGTQAQPSAPTPSSYTVIMDAANGSTIDTCAPCAQQLTAG
jgi:hypothetical protein